MLKFYVFISMSIMSLSLYGDICVTANNAKEAYEKVEAMPSEETVVGTVRVSEINGKTNTSSDVVVSKAFVLSSFKGTEFCFKKSIQNAKLEKTDLVAKNIPTQYQTISPYRDYTEYFNTMISKFADKRYLSFKNGLLNYSIEENYKEFSEWRQYHHFLKQMDSFAKDALHKEKGFFTSEYPNLLSNSGYYAMPFYDNKGVAPYKLRMYTNMPVTKRLYLKVIRYDNEGNMYMTRALLFGAGLMTKSISIQIGEGDYNAFFEIEDDINQPYYFNDQPERIVNHDWISGDYIGAVTKRPSISLRGPYLYLSWLNNMSGTSNLDIYNPTHCFEGRVIHEYAYVMNKKGNIDSIRKLKPEVIDKCQNITPTERREAFIRFRDRVNKSPVHY